MTRSPIIAVLLLALAGPAAAQAPDAALVVDGGLLARRPAALPVGLSTGVGAGVLFGRTWAWGARASWSSATEYTLSWEVRHDDLRLRALGAWQHQAGLGTVALRLGLGATGIYETRTREQGERAGLEGDELRTTAFEVLPAADLELVVVLRVAGAWSVVMSGGPSLELHDGALRAGWLGGLGVAWRH